MIYLYWMIKISFAVGLFQLFCLGVYPQKGKKIGYGNNAAAGKFYDIRGIKMYCEVYGSGKPLLMIHGNGGSIKSFENNIAFFSKKYKVIVADSRSQGKSKDAGDSLSFEMMADDAAVLLDTLHVKSAFVIGWSDGGISALLLAMRHPKKVLKLVSTGANLWPDSTAISPAAWKRDYTAFKLLNNKITGSFTEKNKKKLFMLDWFQPNIPLAALQNIQCPALIVCGDRDVITLEHTVLIYQNIPHAWLWIVPDSGHGTLIEHKDEFNKKTDEFFSNTFHKR
ncbi:MAG: 2-hydroxy-6-oxononadienedioate/2-hydroxy-6-oxononatrienedioate hydrolase [Ferruginibacter sp.]|nr:2-hydroxy-6-oxononadienedioate/2-hydroxy-6-oxononatrienedioate hydrolase [Ferruginibacter sp.]